MGKIKEVPAYNFYLIEKMKNEKKESISSYHVLAGQMLSGGTFIQSVILIQ